MTSFSNIPALSPSSANLWPANRAAEALDAVARRS